MPTYAVRVLTYARHVRKPYVLRTAYADLRQLTHARNSKIDKIIGFGAFYIRLTHSLRVLTLPRFPNSIFNKHCQLTPTYAHLRQLTPRVIPAMLKHAYAQLTPAYAATFPKQPDSALLFTTETSTQFTIGAKLLLTFLVTYNIIKSCLRLQRLGPKSLRTR